MPEYILDLGSPENAVEFHKLPEFTQGYIEAALWTEEERLEEEGLEYASLNDIAPTAWSKMLKDCDDFMKANMADLNEAVDTYSRPMDHLGHDFWLTRNGHGAGFWDRGMEALGERLTTAAEDAGTCGLYLGDDGLVYTA